MAGSPLVLTYLDREQRVIGNGARARASATRACAVEGKFHACTRVYTQAALGSSSTMLVKYMVLLLRESILALFTLVITIMTLILCSHWRMTLSNNNVESVRPNKGNTTTKNYRGFAITHVCVFVSFLFGNNTSVNYDNNVREVSSNFQTHSSASCSSPSDATI